MANRFAKYAQPEVVNPNPMFPGQMQGQQLQNAERSATLPYAAPKAAADASNAATQAGVNAATAPAEIAQKNANARKAAVEAKGAEQNFATTGGANEGQSKSANFYNRALKANQIFAGTGIKDDPMGREVAKTLLPDGLVNAFTSPERQQAEAAMRDFISSTLRYESGAAIAPSEFENQKNIFFPAPGDDPQTVALKAKLRENAIEGLKLSAGPAAPLLAAPQQSVAQTGLADIGKPQMTTEFDAQTSAAVDRLIRLGRPPQEIASFAASKGYPPTPDMLASLAQAQLYLKQHRDYKGGFTQATRGRRMTLGEKVAGSPLGAFGAAAGNAATLGLSDEAAGGINALQGGSYTQGRDAFNANKQLLADAHPYADLAGSIAGSIAPLAGAGRAASLSGLASKVGAGRAATLADLSVGGAYGAGEDNENRLGGAALGVGAAGLGNIAGRGLAKGAASIISPTGGDLASLYALGVRPSIGQRAGGLVNNFEEKLQSLPFVGDAIQGTRQRARDQFQVGLFNDALGEIGQQLPKGMGPGHDPHAFAQRAFNHAYDSAKLRMTAVADGSFGQDIGALQQSVGQLRQESQQQFAKVWKGSIARRIQDGVLAGPAYKDAISDIGKKIAAIRNSKTGDGELADALQQASDALTASAYRNSPPEAVAAMDAADRGYAKLVQLETASKAAGGDAATFTPAQFNSAVKNTSLGVRKRGYLAGNALNSDLAEAGLNLSDVVSNSGTFDRYAPAAALMAGSFIQPKAAIGLGALGVLNAPGVRNLTTALMAPRGGQARTLADILRKQLAGPSGAAGSAVGIGLLPSR
jgi:hypothetical protein